VKALKNIHRALIPGGMFVLETMVSHKAMSFEGPYHFEDSILYRQFTKSKFDLKFFNGAPYLPVRRVPHHLDLEAEIILSELKIIYLYVFSNRKIIADEHRTQVKSSDPDSLRMIALKI
jgi:hypothetical protein